MKRSVRFGRSKKGKKNQKGLIYSGLSCLQAPEPPADRAGMGAVG